MIFHSHILISKFAHMQLHAPIEHNLSLASLIFVCLNWFVHTEGLRFLALIEGVFVVDILFDLNQDYTILN
jgi:hypothetical protein